jgi:membrane-associated phospholipid phosphatase
MQLGIYYPSDVIEGAFVGAGLAYLSYKVNKWLFHPKNIILYNIKTLQLVNQLQK